MPMGRTAAEAKKAGEERGPVVYLKARFQHSKVLPLKREIYDILQHERKIRRDITNLKQHKPLERAWDFSSDAVGKADPGPAADAPEAAVARGPGELV